MTEVQFKPRNRKVENAAALDLEQLNLTGSAGVIGPVSYDDFRQEIAAGSEELIPWGRSLKKFMFQGYDVQLYVSGQEHANTSSIAIDQLNKMADVTLNSLEIVKIAKILDLDPRVVFCAVCLHELGHLLVAQKGMRFGSVIQEEVEAWNQARSINPKSLPIRFRDIDPSIFDRVSSLALETYDASGVGALGARSLWLPDAEVAEIRERVIEECVERDLDLSSEQI